MRHIAAVCVVASISGAAARAQSVEPKGSESIANLPRPGYEAGRWRFGNIVVAPVLSAETQYDSNVFAVSKAAQDDAIFNFGPRVDVTADGSRLNVAADVEANIRRLTTYTTENRVTFGAGTTATYDASPTLSFDGIARFDRGAVNRSDPEASPLLRRPSKTNVILADVGASYRRNRFGIALRADILRVNYLEASEDDRDLNNTSASLRLSWAASTRLGLFVQGYGNRRDAVLPFDRSGVNRDASTIGALAGVTLDISGRWKGDIGVGAFKANSDDPTQASFSDVAVRASLSYTPSPRTAFKLKLVRGDNGTIRSGASGRVNTVAALTFEGEARHNLLVHAAVGFEDTVYRGFLVRHLQQYSVDGEVEYLFGSRWSLYVNARYTDRSANQIFDQYKKTTASIGLRVRV